jgi:DNA invertase Pin-like site-specific DNA recombinase
MPSRDHAPAPISAEHLAKSAYVYIRQSSLGQVLHHPESTTLQYQLVERAIQLGWPRDRVIVIDDDLGKSGTSADQRTGFQQLLAEIGLGRVGLLLSLDASRLARNNRDWYQLLDLCALFGTLLADSERLYDPRTYHDRLLLGLSGILSEAELHHLKLRLHAGERQKAERGELRQPLPVGLLRLRDQTVVLHPDEEVQARLRLVFSLFSSLGSAQAVARALVRDGLPVPTRPLQGPEPHDVVWRPAQACSIRAILHNPAYAGAYVYGRYTSDPTRRRPGHPRSGRLSLPPDQWKVCLQGVYPAYITWETFLTNQERLRQNQCRYRTEKHGVPRQGPALLQGIAVCARCGAHLRLHYGGPHGEYPIYECSSEQMQVGGPRCQTVRACVVDAEVERLVLAALAPDQLELALAALEQLEQEDAGLWRQWELRLERARYEAARAERQYQAVEPEHRLVARTLERQWEDALRALEQTEHEAERWQQQRRLTVSVADRELMLQLGADLPRVWHASSTTDADRKALVRMVIKDVLVDAKRAKGEVWFQVNWQTGASSEHWLRRRVRVYAEYANVEELQQRVCELHGAHKRDDEIAEVLNADGWRGARGRCFSSGMVWDLRKAWGLATINSRPEHRHPSRWEDGSYSVEGAAALLRVYPGTIRKWLRSGQLAGQQAAKGLAWHIPLSDAQIAHITARLEHARRRAAAQPEAADRLSPQASGHRTVDEVKRYDAREAV